MMSGLARDRAGAIHGEFDLVANAPSESSEVILSEAEPAETPLEATFERPADIERPAEASGHVELTPLGGKDLVDELSFNENPVAVVETSGLVAMGEAASARGYLWILLRTPGPQHRGRLGLYIEETIENQLEERGALPPGIHASTGLDASLSDQLYRARLVEMRGIALGIPSLEGITNLGRVLDAEDSAVLRWWMAATSDRPVRMVLSQENTKLRVYPSPVFFQSLFEVAPGSVTPIPPSPSMAASAVTMELSDLPPPVEEVGRDAETNVFGTAVATWESLAPKRSFAASVIDEAADSEVAYSEAADGWEAANEKVALPDLDRALGLTPSRNASESSEAIEAASIRSEEGNRRSFARVRASEQLLLMGLEPQKVTPGPHTQALLAELDAEAEHAAVESPSAAPVLSGELMQADLLETWSSSDATDIDDIDTEEFLRTLEEDSSRAPEVRAAEAGASAGVASREPTLPTPLPTKKIKRNPFIRLAEQAEVSTETAPVTPELEDPNDLISESGSVDEAKAQDSEPVQVTAGPALPDSLASTSQPIHSDLANLADPFNQLAAREWKTWVRNLEAARGPKPLSVIERMFVTDYTRLREAVRRGVADKSANSILDEWQSSFTTSYSEAFDALRVRGKRPTMVLDLPELATRLGRLQGARRVQLLMVDGLRFDLGLMVQERMRSTADASLTERLLLWSALPSVTSYQLELLGKGPDGLKEPGDIDEPPALVARGAAARSPRRVRTGSLELLKLDIVADAIRQPGPPILERMDSLADETASAIVEHLAKQAPRTMVVVFGDHGFAIDPSASGTTEEVKQGGASPEEVLVPAFAWLTGAVH